MTPSSLKGTQNMQISCTTCTRRREQQVHDSEGPSSNLACSLRSQRGYKRVSKEQWHLCLEANLLLRVHLRFRLCLHHLRLRPQTPDFVPLLFTIPSFNPTFLPEMCLRSAMHSICVNHSLRQSKQHWMPNPHLFYQHLHLAGPGTRS